MEKEQNETYPIYVTSINTLNPEKIQFKRVYYITILTMNLLPHQPFSHTSLEMLSAECRQRNHASKNVTPRAIYKWKELAENLDFIVLQNLYKV